MTAAVEMLVHPVMLPPVMPKLVQPEMLGSTPLMAMALQLLMDVDVSFSIRDVVGVV